MDGVKGLKMKGFSDVEGGGVEMDKVVEVKLIFGPTLPFLPLSVEVGINATWGEILEKIGIKEVGSKDLVIIAPPPLKLPGGDKSTPFAFLDEKVAVLEQKLHSLNGLRVLRNGGPSWLTVYKNRLSQILDGNVLKGFSPQELQHAEILRNINNLGEFSVSDFASPQQMLVGIPKELLECLSLMTKWGQAGEEFQTSVDSKSSAQQLVEKVSKFCSSIEEKPLIKPKVYKALRKALDAASAIPHKLDQPLVVDGLTKTLDLDELVNTRLLTDASVKAAVGSSRLIISLMPHARTRMLSSILYFIKEILNNDKFVSELGLTKHVLMKTFLPLFSATDYWRRKDDEVEVSKLVAFMMNHHNELFNCTEEKDPLNSIAQAMTRDIPLKNFYKWSEEAGEHDGGNCKKMSVLECERNKTELTQTAKEEVFRYCVNPEIEEARKLAMLLEFKERYPDIYNLNHGDSALDRIKEEIRMKRKGEHKMQQEQEIDGLEFKKFKFSSEEEKE